MLVIPEGNLIPEGATFYEGEDDKLCRVVKADGTRCRGTRLKAYGLCSGHAGVGGIARDPRGSARLAHAEKRKRSQARATLGISTRRAAQPVQLARLRAQERAEAFAHAIVDAPLDDPELGSVARQRAAIAAVELLYPQVTAQLEVELPNSEEDARSWAGSSCSSCVRSTWMRGYPRGWSTAQKRMDSGIASTPTAALAVGEWLIQGVWAMRD